MVRIRLPPAKSRLRTRLSGTHPINDPEPVARRYSSRPIPYCAKVLGASLGANPD